MAGTNIPYPAPYIKQEEQKATPRIEKPIRDPRAGWIKIIIAVSIIIVMLILIYIFSM